MKRILLALVCLWIAAAVRSEEPGAKSRQAGSGNVEEQFQRGSSLYRKLAGNLNLPGTMSSGASKQYRLDVEEMEKCWLMAAEQGHLEAQKALAYGYTDIRTIPMIPPPPPKFLKNDSVASARWWRRAAEQGDAPSEEKLAELHVAGLGVAKDSKAALAWYEKAAGHGRVSAMVLTAESYAKGVGTSRDVKTALGWYRRAADAGHLGAQFALAEACASGEGVARDEAEALAWYRKAALRGHRGALRTLGTLYFSGRMVKQDYVEAFAWLSADYIPQDRAEAVDWGLAKSSFTGLPKDAATQQVERMLAETRKALGPDGIAAAEKRARELDAEMEQDPTVKQWRANNAAMETQFAENRAKAEKEKLAAQASAAESAGNSSADTVPAEAAAKSGGGLGRMFKDLFSATDKKLSPPPQPRVQAQPTYPFHMRRAGIGGYVDLEFVITTTGEVADVRVIKSSHEDFEAPAIRAIAQWRFKPGRVRGKPVNVLAKQRLEFNASDN